MSNRQDRKSFPPDPHPKRGAAVAGIKPDAERFLAVIRAARAALNGMAAEGRQRRIAEIHVRHAGAVEEVQYPQRRKRP